MDVGGEAFGFHTLAVLRVCFSVVFAWMIAMIFRKTRGRRSACRNSGVEVLRILTDYASDLKRKERSEAPAPALLASQNGDQG